MGILKNSKNILNSLNIFFEKIMKYFYIEIKFNISFLNISSLNFIFSFPNAHLEKLEIN